MGKAYAIETQQIVETVLRELKGRSGFDSWWDNIDSDIQDELLSTLLEKVDLTMQSIVASK